MMLKTEQERTTMIVCIGLIIICLGFLMIGDLIGRLVDAQITMVQSMQEATDVIGEGAVTIKKACEK